MATNELVFESSFLLFLIPSHAQGLLGSVLTERSKHRMLEMSLTCRMGMVLTGALLQVPPAPRRGAMGQGWVKMSRNTTELARQDRSADL